MARETGFVKRESKLGGALFLELVVFNSETLKDQSLTDLSILMAENHGIAIAKQSLHERFNDHAIAFLKKALEQILQQQLEVEPSLLGLDGIKRILIKDSVCFQVDESLQDDFPGSGGDGSKAAVRIQFEYDLLSGCVNDLSLSAFNDQDATNSLATMELVQQGDLIIRDLAYVGLSALDGFIKRQAFYLCRLGTGTKVYECVDGQWIELKFDALHKELKRQHLDMLEKEVRIGKQDQLTTRLIIHKLPSEEIEKRIRKARQNAKRKGRNAPTKEYIARAHLNLFITNTNSQAVPTNRVWSLYRLRWQIELAFKAWKSICDLEKVKKVKRQRLECYIYARLIFIMLGWRIAWSTKQQVYKLDQKAVSLYKLFKTLATVKLNDMKDLFMSKTLDLGVFMYRFYLTSRKHHLLEKKKGSPSSLELLVSCATD